MYALAGVVIGVVYSLMAVGITFIVSIMKIINWAMGEYYMIGGYIAFFLIVGVLGAELWYVAIPIVMGIVFVIGVITQILLLSPMYTARAEIKDEYATIITIALMILFRNLMVYIEGAEIRAPPEYFPTVVLGRLPISGTRVVAMVSALIIFALFYLGLKKTWTGQALQATAQSRRAVETIGVNPRKMDRLAFGIGVALAAAAGALLAPEFLVYPDCGEITVTKGFIIIVLGGMGSIWGAFIGGIILGLTETLGSFLLNPSWRDAYGLFLLVALLVLRPRGLFGEKEREI